MSTRKNNYALVNLQVTIEIYHRRYILMLIDQVILWVFSLSVSELFLTHSVVSH